MQGCWLVSSKHLMAFKGDQTAAMKCWWLASLAVMLLVAPPPVIAAEPGEDPPLAFWGEFIYTVLEREKLVWTVTPSFRTDEQEINGNGVTRFTTEATVALPKEEWELRSRLFVIGRAKEDGGAAFDQRVQFLVRYPLTHFWKDQIAVDGGTLYERHFRGDEVPDFNVYRQRVELSADDWKYSPWTQQDFSFDHTRGFYRTRTRLGVLWNFKRNVQIALAYQYQYTQRPFAGWEPQHSLLFRYWFGTRLSFRGRNRSTD